MCLFLNVSRSHLMFHYFRVEDVFKACVGALFHEEKSLLE